MELVSNWRDFWRMWSIRLVAFGTGLVALFTEFPDAATNIWLALPADLKSYLPPDFGRYFGYALLALGIVARVIRQRKLVERKQAIESAQEPDAAIARG